MSLAMYGITGEMCIEEHSTHAVGRGGGGWFGLALEGSPLLFAVVPGVLVVACYAVYRHLRV